MRGDELRIRQVLTNILSNAVKFTPEEGCISLCVRERDGADIRRGNDRYYEFAVSDNGRGMSPEFIKRIYDPFERASGTQNIGRQRPGHGDYVQSDEDDEWPDRRIQ